MFTFTEFLSEAKKKRVEGDFKTGDSAGKLFELLKAKEQNRGSFPDSHRAEGKTPTDIHNIMAAKLFGDNYEKHPQYKNLVKTAYHAARANNAFNEKEHAHDANRGYRRVAWTSQSSDHLKETGHEDSNSVADSIPTLSHGGQIAHSDKLTGQGQGVNYKNPGIDTMETIAGTPLSQHIKRHSDLLKTVGLRSGDNGHKEFKRLRASSDPEEREIADSVKRSADIVNQGVAKSIHSGLLAQQAHDVKHDTSKLRDTILSAVAPKTHLKTVVTHTEVDDQGNHAHTKVYDLHHHVNEYLNNFERLHVEPHHKEGQSSVAIYGHHKKTGNRMRIMNLSVYSGGRPTNSSPRGAITLPSENHKDIEYTKHYEVDGNGNQKEAAKPTPKKVAPASIGPPPAINMPPAPAAPKAKKVKQPITSEGHGEHGGNDFYGPSEKSQ